MSVNDIHRNIADGDGDIKIGQTMVADAQTKYNESSQLARKLSGMVQELSTTFAEMQIAHAAGNSNISLADIAVGEAVQHYGPQGADLERSRHTEAQQTIELARNYRECIQDVHASTTKLLTEVERTAEDIQRLQEGIGQFVAGCFLILGVTVQDEIPAIQKLGSAQQKASQQLKERIG
jgi:hypothetical protein